MTSTSNAWENKEHQRRVIIERKGAKQKEKRDNEGRAKKESYLVYQAME